MRLFQENKVKAFFLACVFSLNTVVGFACSVGLDMGFNSKHHHEDDESTEAVMHIHSDSKKHIHCGEKNAPRQSKSHNHEEGEDHHQSKDGKDDCCNDQVLKFEQTDKSIPHSLNIIHPNFLIALFDFFYNVTLPASGRVKDIRQFVRSYHPPIPDIRIAIQSFLI